MAKPATANITLTIRTRVAKVGFIPRSSLATSEGADSLVIQRSNSDDYRAQQKCRIPQVCYEESGQEQHQIFYICALNRHLISLAKSSSQLLTYIDVEI